MTSKQPDAYIIKTDSSLQWDVIYHFITYPFKDSFFFGKDFSGENVLLLHLSIDNPSWKKLLIKKYYEPSVHNLFFRANQ